MLNYIWGGLIVSSLIFALAIDIGDLSNDRYRNGDPLEVQLVFDEPFNPGARLQAVEVRIDPAEYQSFYGTDEEPAASYHGTLYTSELGLEVRFARDVALPEPFSTIRDFTAKRESELLAEVSLDAARGANSASGAVVFRNVEFVKMNAIGGAAFDFAETAVTLSLSLIGILALWLGLLRIAEKAGLIEVLVKVIQPIFRPIFPEIPKDDPAMGVIGLYMTANILGLSNAATPLGIKAMESLQDLNPSDDTATNDQVTLLALATGSVQLVPPTLLVAVMGLQVNQLVFGIIIATVISTTAGLLAAKFLARTKRFKATDPHRLALQMADTSQ
ncbi:MAG: nucleoside recognition domain-containing protein, partial [Rhodothermia bacterium]